MSKALKTTLLAGAALAVGILVGNTSYVKNITKPVAPTASTAATAPVDKKIHIFGEKNQELGTVDPEKNTFEVAKGQKCEDAVLAAVAFSRNIAQYHEKFKADILSGASPEVKKKFEAPAAPVAQKEPAKGPHK